VATSELPARVTAAVAEQRQLQMERNDFEAWRVQTASVVATEAVNAAWEQMAALVEAKQAQLEANQLHASQTVAQAVAEQRQLRMDRADFLTGHR
jgi:hypothetical protein